MNYQKLYNNLINKCVTRGWSKKSTPCYTEKHHIKPKCLGGDNSEDNLVVLTAREHYMAHLLLAKIHGGRLWFPLKMMMIGKHGCIINSSMYEIAKIKASAIIGKSNKGLKRTKETRKKISIVNKGKKLSQEHCSNLSESRKGEKNPNYGKKHSQETRDKMSIAKKGKKLSQEHCSNLSKARIGKHNGVDHHYYGKVGILSHSFKGYYHTPFGVFESSNLAAKGVRCSQSAIRKRIKNPNFPEYWFEQKKDGE